jgi:hypothetical protein
MKVGRLASGLGVGLWLSACAAQPAPESSSPAASQTSTTKSAEGRAVAPDELVAPAPPPAAPQGLEPQKDKAEEADLSTLEAAERALNQAQADLDRLALAEPPASLNSRGASDRAAAKKENKPARAPAPAAAAAPSKTGMCEEACRAFSSLTRAANAVCRLDGNAGSHCSHAKHVLEGAQQRVASCSCPSAGD